MRTVRVVIEKSSVFSNLLSAMYYVKRVKLWSVYTPYVKQKKQKQIELRNKDN